MSRVLAIAVREVRSYLQDRGDLAFSLLLPIAIFALMYGAFSGQTLFNGTAYIVNLDADGAHAQRLIERLDEQEGLQVSLLTLEDANARLERSDILVAAIVPEDFSARLDSGWPTQITFRQRGNGGTEGQIVASMVRAEADAVSRELQVRRQVLIALAGKGVSEEQVRTTVEGLLEKERRAPAVDVVDSTIGGEVSLVDQFMPGIMSMFVLMAITLGSRALVEERKKGTLERLLSTRLSVAELYMGKLTAGVARGFVQVLILLVLAGLVFRLFSAFEFLSLLLVSLLFVAAASTLALIIASIARTEDQAISISIVFTMATVMLGGTFFEIPEDTFLSLTSKVALNTYVNSAFKAIMSGGAGVADLATELIVLAGTVVVGLILSRTLFRVVIGGR
ncbi:MAG: ABC transporter permease [Dehalococcoidia bacterium]|nr:ABC transporter permease [Dehalococcoidia bacterium]